MDGGFDFTLLDLFPQSSTNRTDVLFIGQPLVTPFALPFARVPAARPCTFALQPIVNLDFNGNRAGFTQVSIPRGLPLALRPVSLSVQVVTLRSGVVTGGPHVISNQPTTLDFQ